jgi:hypothetical protein
VGSFVFGLAGLLVGGADMAEAGPGVAAEAIRALNVQGALNRPANAEAPGIFQASRACYPNHFCAFGEMP